MEKGIKDENRKPSPSTKFTKHFVSPKMLSSTLLFHTTDATRLGAGFFPSREEAIHEGIEVGAMVGDEEVGQFVNNYVFYAPLG